MIVVTLHHQTLLMQSTQQTIQTLDSGDTGIKLGGAGGTGTVVRTKESSNIWDEEW